MKTLILVLVSLFTQFALAEGVISGGGIPGPVEIPTEDFDYTCDVGYAQQIDGLNGNEGCYMSFSAKAVLKKNVDSPDMYGELGTVNIQDLNWKRQSINGKCTDEAPISRENTFFSISVFKNKGGGAIGDQFATSLYIRVAAPENILHSANADTTTPYAAGVIKAGTRLITPPGRVLSMSAECKLTRY